MSLNDLSSKELKKRIAEAKQRAKEERLRAKEELKQAKLRAKQEKLEEKQFKEHVKEIAKLIKEEIIKNYNNMKSNFIVKGDTYIIKDEKGFIKGKVGDKYFSTQLDVPTSDFDLSTPSVGATTDICVYEKMEDGSTITYKFPLNSFDQPITRRVSIKITNTKLYDYMKNKINESINNNNSR